MFRGDKHKIGRIYGLCEPNCVSTIESVRYVGKTTRSLQRRMAGHMWMANHGEKTYRSDWIRSLGGKTPILIVLSDNVPLEHLDELEKIWIKHFRLVHKLSNGPAMTNHADGGGGGNGGRAKGFKRTEEEKKAMSERMKGNNFGSYTKGIKKPPLTEEHKAKLSKGPIVDQHGTVYLSVSKAATQLKLQPANVAAVVRGTARSAGGFVFKKVAADGQ